MNITGGKYNGQKVLAPDDAITRPTLSKVRMSIFNTLYSMIDYNGASFLDMYSGSGIMSLEAVSRGFDSALAIEKNKKSFNVIKRNFEKFAKAENLELILGDSLKICQNLNRKFDVIYIDPPYFSEIYEKSLDAVKDLTSGIIILEHVVPIKISDFKLIKQKKYSDKYITFLKL